jgi:integrase
MTEQAISPLRRRMIEDMTIRKFAQKTQHDYVQRVKDFANYLKRSPDTATPEDVRGFQLHLTSSGAGTPKINATVAALRFFFRATLDRPDLSRHLSTIQMPLKLPFVLSPDEVARFLEAAPGIKYKAAFSVAYGAGLRVSEVAFLKVTDIDSKRMMLRIEQGKGRKDRYAMLSPTLLELLRDWYRVARPQGWLFPGQNPTNPITARQLTRACHADLRIYVQEVRALHTAAANGGMRVAVRLPGMRHACPPCPPDGTRLPHDVGRSAPGRRKVRAQHRRIARPAAIFARSCWMVQEVETCPEAETCPGESVSPA